MNWLQIIAALYVLGLAFWLYLCDTAPLMPAWMDE